MMCLVLAVVRLQQGFGAVDALLSAVTLAVAAIPEEFPVVFTFFLGVGVYRLARRQALVRRGVVVENIGRVSCICSDKTGTLTEGRLRLAHFLPGPSLAETMLLEVAAIASRREGGDPLDTALLDAADAAGIATPERLATFPFTEDRRRETAVVPRPDGVRVVVKGAPETVLGMTDLDADARGQWLANVTDFAAGGHKVIACGYRDLTAWTGDEPADGVVFAGLLAFEDPVREGVADAVARCRDAGIRVVMVTGDHPVTATAIAAEVGLGAGAPRVIDAAALEGLPAADLDGVDVVARAMPANKLALVRRFQAAGHVVAVTGDGVNDVPALQAADIGIAMGERGTRSAREAAAVVLLDDNFRSIVGAIAEGRQLFRNLQRSFAYLLMLHLPLVVTAARGSGGGLPVALPPDPHRVARADRPPDGAAGVPGPSAPRSPRRARLARGHGATALLLAPAVDGDRGHGARRHARDHARLRAQPRRRLRYSARPRDGDVGADRRRRHHDDRAERSAQPGRAMDRGRRRWPPRWC